MTPNKKLITITAISALAFIFLYNDSTSSQKPPDVNLTDSHAGSVTHTRNQAFNNATAHQPGQALMLPTLPQAVTKKSHSSDTLSKNPVEESDSSLVTTDDSIEDVSKDYLAKGNEFHQWMLANIGKQDFDINAEMESRFEAEDIDFGWANDEENKLYSLFDNNRLLAGLALKDALCRSTQCQIKIAISDIEQANDVVQQLSEAINSASDGEQPVMIIATPDQAYGVTTLYVSRGKDSFNFH